MSETTSETKTSTFVSNIKPNREDEKNVYAKTRIMVSSMRLERYYSSVREDASALVEDAVTLLDRRDYVGFFKSCGPNYVRGIRRAQEVVATFTFKSNNPTSTALFGEGLARQDFGNGSSTNDNKKKEDFNAKSRFKKINESLSITIKGYGLALGFEGDSGTLVATSLKEYNDIMRFAFRSMTQSENGHNVGMVYGIEVVPWVDNTAYQVAANLMDAVIQLPTPRSLIPKALNILNISDTVFVVDRIDEFYCKAEGYVIDKYGYCCEKDNLFDFDTGTYNSDTPAERTCKPLRDLGKPIIMNNLVSNGEFVARLDASLSSKLNQMSRYENCLSAANGIPTSYDYYTLKTIDIVKYDKSDKAKFTLAELKFALDPFNDYSMLSQIGRDVEEFIEMYYSPCMAALFGSNIGTSSDTDSTYFMAYPWHTHAECLHLSCLGENMRWDRSIGGCVGSLLVGTTSKSYDNTDSDCVYDENNECRYSSADLAAYHNDAISCWNSKISTGSIAFFLSYFCAPELDKELEATAKATLKATLESNTCSKPATTTF